MRSLERFGVVVLGVLLIGCRGVSPMIDLGPVRANNVTIVVRCKGQQAQISLVPWRRALDGGGTVTFNLRGGLNSVSTVTIQPKDSSGLSSWPFNGRDITVSIGAPATTPAAPSNEGSVVYPYSVRATCDFPAGPDTEAGPRDVIVDPDLIVRGTSPADSVSGTPAER